MATFPWAEAMPSSYFVSPLAVISSGCLCVPACPNAEAQAQNNPKTVKTSLRIAGCEATEGVTCCKGKRVTKPGRSGRDSKPGHLLVKPARRDESALHGPRTSLARESLSA